MSYANDCRQLRKDILDSDKSIKKVFVSGSNDFDFYIVARATLGKDTNITDLQNELIEKFGDRLEIISGNIDDYDGTVKIYCKYKIQKYGIDLEIEQLEQKLKELKKQRKEEIEKENLLAKKQALLKQIKELELEDDK